jgi:hypothetical protein
LVKGLRDEGGKPELGVTKFWKRKLKPRQPVSCVSALLYRNRSPCQVVLICKPSSLVKEWLTGTSCMQSRRGSKAPVTQSCYTYRSPRFFPCAARRRNRARAHASVWRRPPPPATPATRPSCLRTVAARRRAAAQASRRRRARNIPSPRPGRPRPGLPRYRYPPDGSLHLHRYLVARPRQAPRRPRRVRPAHLGQLLPLQPSRLDLLRRGPQAPGPRGISLS